MSKLIIDFSPFHSRKLVSVEYAESAIRLFKYSNRNAKAYKKLYMESSECEFSFPADKGIKDNYHKLGEMRNVGEYFNRMGYTMGLSYNTVASNSRGGHNIKRDISMEDRENHRIMVSALAEKGISAGNTWSAQTQYLNSEKGISELSESIMLIDSYRNQPTKGKKGKAK